MDFSQKHITLKNKSLTKVFFLRILSIFLSLGVLFATMSFSVNTHYCCNELVATSFFIKAKNCNYKIPDKRPKICVINEAACCQDKFIAKTGREDLKKVDYIVNLYPFALSNTSIYPYNIDLFEGLQQKNAQFIHYSPPLISKDILILHETFLI
ncbi:hypothetical protein [Gramella sp. AN32]|uniref:Uncharacterized protein n=1 Tax=Christiangramia antarctica TaxID=2058158 RepID=A0ABW5X1R7_9FLAO|nr:hypothetical protein [Gramella sp. AN32]MCM4156639.1 hypothetical protein [Gramella sp. AN32]